ncbi:hypothetical protein, conserved, partial [Trypanosoma cruzi]
LTIHSEVPYTEEEKTFLLEQLVALSQEQQERQHDDDDKWTRTTVPLLVSMLEKVLQLAADNYEDDSNNNNISNSAGTTTTAATNQKPKGGGATTLAAKPLSKMECFLEENDYIIEQMQQQQRPFFTLPRLLEILADPFIYNRDAAGKLRGGKLQAAVRRCVLVSYPLLTVQWPFTSEVNPA